MSGVTLAAPLVRPRGSSVDVVRPMFQVLFDDAQRCRCHLYGSQLCRADYEVMQVPASEYERPDRIFL